MPEETPRRAATIEMRVEDVSKSFDEQIVLGGVTFPVERGEILAIVGGSGCGKTVLLHCATGIMTPDRGQVRVANHEADGAPLVDLTIAAEEEMDAVRRHWAIVFQHNALLSGTVEENLSLWLEEVRGLDEDEIARRVREAVESVGLDPERVLEEQRDELSGGMAKRVAIARALALDPVLVFYDEPTTGLDPHHAGLIHELIATTHWRRPETGEARTSIVITHDRELLRRLEPRVIMLHRGCIHFDGTYEAFARSRSTVIRPYFEEMPVLHRHRR